MIDLYRKIKTLKSIKALGVSQIPYFMDYCTPKYIFSKLQGTGSCLSCIRLLSQLFAGTSEAYRAGTSTAMEWPALKPGKHYFIYIIFAVKFKRFYCCKHCKGSFRVISNPPLSLLVAKFQKKGRASHPAFSVLVQTCFFSVQ